MVEAPHVVKKHLNTCVDGDIEMKWNMALKSGLAGGVGSDWFSNST